MMLLDARSPPHALSRGSRRTGSSGQQLAGVRTGSYAPAARHRVDHGTIWGRNCAIRDTINHYGPVFIAPLSIRIRRAGVQKKFAAGLIGRNVFLELNGLCVLERSLEFRQVLFL